jgi:hypothetical protein
MDWHGGPFQPRDNPGSERGPRFQGKGNGPLAKARRRHLIYRYITWLGRNSVAIMEGFTNFNAFRHPKKPLVNILAIEQPKNSRFGKRVIKPNY